MPGSGDEVSAYLPAEHHKRQHLPVEADEPCALALRLRSSGVASDEGYVAHLRRLAVQAGVEDRVIIESKWITEEKMRAAARRDRWRRPRCPSTRIPRLPDPRGLPSARQRCTRSPRRWRRRHGVRWRDGVTGHSRRSGPGGDRRRARQPPRLDRQKTARMERRRNDRIREFGIDWDTVIGQLLAAKVLVPNTSSAVHPRRCGKNCRGILSVDWAASPGTTPRKCGSRFRGIRGSASWTRCSSPATCASPMSAG